MSEIRTHLALMASDCPRGSTQCCMICHTIYVDAHLDQKITHPVSHLPIAPFREGPTQLLIQPERQMQVGEIDAQGRGSITWTYPETPHVATIVTEDVAVCAELRAAGVPQYQIDDLHPKTCRTSLSSCPLREQITAYLETR